MHKETLRTRCMALCRAAISLLHNITNRSFTILIASQVIFESVLAFNYFLLNKEQNRPKDWNEKLLWGVISPDGSSLADCDLWLRTNPDHYAIWMAAEPVETDSVSADFWIPTMHWLPAGHWETKMSKRWYLQLQNPFIHSFISICKVSITYTVY